MPRREKERTATLLYFDNAATTMTKPPQVLEAVMRAMETFGGVGRGVHPASLAAAVTVFEAREALAALFGAPSASRVSFTLNATEALNIAIEGLLAPGEHAITTAASHNSVLRPLYLKQEKGSELSILQVGPDGSIDFDAFEQLFQSNTRLVVATHASNLSGDVYDISRMGRLCKEQGALFVVDTAQTAGLLPLDMQQMHIDVLVFTGHKSLYGPQGTGGLCVADDVYIPPFKVGGSGTQSFAVKHPTHMPESLEAGTLNAHGIAGLLAGVTYLHEKGIASLSQQTSLLTERFKEGVRAIEGIKIHGGHNADQCCGIVALTLGNCDSAFVSESLSTDYAICTRAGAHCAPLMHKSLGTCEQGAVRFSFCHFNTVEEIDKGVEALGEIAQRYRNAQTGAW